MSKNNETGVNSKIRIFEYKIYRTVLSYFTTFNYSKIGLIPKEKYSYYF